MAAIPPHDRPVLQSVSARPRRHRGMWRALLLIPLMCIQMFSFAQAGGAKAAIERLENCRGEPSCIRILKRQSAGRDKQAIKAQVRGGRIIWYEYNTKTGSVRRTN